MNYIDSYISTEATRKLVRAMLPVMIHWAKTGQTDHTYGELAAAIGRPKYHRLGHQLGCIQNVIDALSEATKREIPTLNSLVRNKEEGIPADGFSFVSKKYKELDKAGKIIFVEGLNSIACNYSHWDWVLKELGLSEYKPFTKAEIEEITNPKGGYGSGEGEEHKKLKEYVCAHPEAIGATNVVFNKTEHLLPSGDKLDVYFELEDGTRLAVEVKSSISNDADITRGIFQCVKYKAVMDALQTIDTEDYDVKVLLVTSRDLSDIHARLIKELSINQICIDFHE